ncbi:MAG: biotin/lipoyl-binding protein [Bacteroidetes bacterium]|nr:biotin/lipoyl-binding protein [Bacteroidota bacterium]
MKKFNFKINGNDYHVQVKNIEGDTAEIEVNGSVYEVEIEKKLAQPITPKLVRERAVPSTDVDKSTVKTTKPAPKATGGIKSPLPGTILEVFVKVGDKVKMGDKLLILEAMKMENKIDADKPGTIKELVVKQGDTVMEGDLLLVIGD